MLSGQKFDPLVDDRLVVANFGKQRLRAKVCGHNPSGECHLLGFGNSLGHCRCQKDTQATSLRLGQHLQHSAKKKIINDWASYSACGKHLPQSRKIVLKNPGEQFARVAATGTQRFIMSDQGTDVGQ